MLPEKIKNDIIMAMTEINPERVVLFGSYAWGSPDKNSDIDLYIVTKDDFLPQNWDEKSSVYLNVIKKFDSLQKNIPVDAIVHTKPMYNKFISMDSMFSRKIMRDGIILI